MNERLKENIAYALDHTYNGYEDAMMENDVTKDDFREMEKELTQVAILVGLERKTYPFKLTLK